MDPWVEPLCAIAATWRSSGKSIGALFEAAQPPLEDRASFLALVTDWLQQHPGLVDQWRVYSLDKRTTPAPYFSRGGKPLEVGFYDPDLGALEVSQHTDAIEACADFLYREAAWVLRRDRPPRRS
jgi:hypothetical protein